MNKRTFLKSTALWTGISLLNPWKSVANLHTEEELTATNPLRLVDFSLPDLPYPHEALEPHFDKLTMEIHHGKHHAAYVKNLNEAVKNTPYSKLNLADILATITDKFPAIRNNAGGHYNHSLFWTILKPNGGGAPTGKLGEVINATFGSFEKFKETFNKAAMGRFGSGWAWLAVDKKQKLFISSTPNQDNPLMTKIVAEKGNPILCLDVWEHAYYLKYQNKRVDYVNAFWNLINWEEVNGRYLMSVTK
jgi:superoxide dismutase, Fe-Mn family